MDRPLDTGEITLLLAEAAVSVITDHAIQLDRRAGQVCIIDQITRLERRLIGPAICSTSSSKRTQSQLSPTGKVISTRLRYAEKAAHANALHLINPLMLVAPASVASTLAKQIG